jgi:hypothetical protein
VYIVPRMSDKLKETLFYQHRDIVRFQYSAALEKAGFDPDSVLFQEHTRSMQVTWIYGIILAIVYWTLQK